MDLLSYLKIPFQHKGRDFSGSDCFGLIRLFYAKELGIELQDYTEDYPEDWWKDQNLFLDLYKSYNFKKVKTFEFGNLILFKNTSQTPGHVGVVIDECNFVHMTKTGAGTNNYLYGPWARQIHSIYKLKKAKKKCL